jgi:phosphorylcholine metabolism protein LicD
MKYWTLVVIVFSQAFCALQGAAGTEPQKQWIDLDMADPSTRLTTLKNHVFTNSSHFPPLYQAADDLQKLFALAGIDAMGIFGCALGILRIGECLPWDDDIDYGVHIQDEKKIKALAPLANKLGYDLFADDLVGYKFYRREQIVDPHTTESHYVFIDIFLFQPQDDKYVLVREKGRATFPKAWFLKQEFETRTVLSCGPLKMPCSMYTEDSLLRIYGEKCKTEALFYFSHIKDVKTFYKWTIRETDDYPSFKKISLRDRVSEELLPSMSFDDWQSFIRKLTE